MLMKALRYIGLVLVIFLWAEAYFPEFYLAMGKSHLFPDDYRYGDLYRLSFLPQFKEKASICPDLLPGKSADHKTNIFIIGDSFTEEQRVNANDFKAQNYDYTHWAKSKDIVLDTAQRNVLILETVERTFREHFGKEADNFRIVKNPGKNEENAPKPYVTKKQRLENFIKIFFPGGTEERLEHTLFNYDFFLFFKEIKAAFNLRFFDRAEKKVVLSKDRQSLFYFEEVESGEHQTSSFSEVSEAEIQHLVEMINQTQDKYKKAGFDEVYLSIIPNKVSILAPDLGKYNHIIEKVQTDRALKVPVIDVYSDFVRQPSEMYLKSDTHWSCAGRDIWLKKVNYSIFSPESNQ